MAQSSTEKRHEPTTDESQSSTIAPNQPEVGFLRSLKSNHVDALWAQSKRILTSKPTPTSIPHVWRLDELRPALMESVKFTSSGEDSERRIFMLTNPNREIPYTTDTLTAALQLVTPGEAAANHSHTAFVIRYVVEGQGAYAIMEGKKIQMERGDVIVTPSRSWHDHHHQGPSPMIWLDGLDDPNFLHLPVHFFEVLKGAALNHSTESDEGPSPFRFPWAEMKMKLDAASEEWAAHRYGNIKGQEVSRTLGGSAERIDAKKCSPSRRETASSVYHVIEGAGHTQIDDETLSWSSGDTFCIPAWCIYQHFADAASAVYLFRFDDRPMLKALGYYRIEGPEEG